MQLPDKVYNVLKWIVIVFLPALSTFLGLILQTFNVAHTDIVLTILAGFITFLGTILGISSVQYNKNSNNNAQNK